MPIGLPELLILFVAALLIFGPKKLPEMGSAIGKSLTAFRKGWQEISNETSEDAEIMERRAELKRLELEALDREIAAKRATLLAPPAAATVLDASTEVEYSNSTIETATTEITDALNGEEIARTEITYTETTTRTETVTDNDTFGVDSDTPLVTEPDENAYVNEIGYTSYSRETNELESTGDTTETALPKLPVPNVQEVSDQALGTVDNEHGKNVLHRESAESTEEKTEQAGSAR
jgi:sec-independent protein translocase protein TatA